MRSFFALVSVGTFGFLAINACSSSSTSNGNATGSDASTIQTNEAGVPITSDGSIAGTTFNDFTSASYWSSFDLTTLNKNADGYFGGVFDGRYVYFVPNLNGVNNGIVTRYDTHGDFATASDWAT